MALSKDIQAAIVTKLGTVAALAGVTIIGRRTGVITNDIDSAVAQLGAAIFVFPAIPTDVNANLPGPYADKMEVRVRCIELPSINATLPDAYEQAEAVLVNLCGFAPVPTVTRNRLIPYPKPVELIDDPERVIFDITFFFSAGYQPVA